MPPRLEYHVCLICNRKYVGWRKVCEICIYNAKPSVIRKRKLKTVKAEVMKKRIERIEMDMQEIRKYGFDPITTLFSELQKAGLFV